MGREFKYQKKLALSLTFLFMMVGSTAGHALPLSVVPTPLTALPTKVQLGSPVMAYYTITNQTKYAQSNIYIKYFPPNVTQITSNSTFTNTCGQKFNLAPGGSCIVQLQIAGAINASDPNPHHHLFVCLKGGTSCIGASLQLNVSILAYPISLFTAAGSVYIGGGGDGPPSPDPVGPYGPPLQTESMNGGSSWALTSPAGLPIYGGFYSTSCTGTEESGICIAAGEDDSEGSTTSYGIAQPLLFQTRDGGSQWNGIMSSTITPLPNLPTSGFFHATSCTGSGATAVCIVVGEDDTNVTAGTTNPKTASPLLAFSSNGGETWTVNMSTTIPLITNLPTYGVLNAVDCSGGGHTAVCIAAGEDDTNVVNNSGSGAVPLLIISTDGGGTWTVLSSATASFIANLPIPWTGVLNAASCTGDDLADTVCMTSGVSGSPASPAPLVINSAMGAGGWSVATIAGLPSTGSFSSASCTGNGASAICIAAGQNSTSIIPVPLLVSSLNAGNSWSVVTVPQVGSSGYYNSASCTGNGFSAICVAVGRNSTGFVPQPLLVTSNIGVSHWSAVSVPISPLLSAVFNTTSCSGTGTEAVCIAAGNIGPDNVFIEPLLMTNANGWNLWQVALIPDITTAVPYGVFGSSAN